jgi:tetratricopeptide (TPR) repeat protein
MGPSALMNRFKSFSTNLRCAGAILPMLRTVLLAAAAALLSIAGPASANPQLGDDLTVCRDRQNDLKTRADACEKIIASGTAAPKDLAVALLTRGDTQAGKRDYDKAIATYNDGLKSDPDNVRILEGRGIAYANTGQEELAMADYNAALQKRPNYAAPYNSRGVLYLRKGALQSAFDDFSAAVRLSPKYALAYANRARVETMNKNYDAALADFAKAAELDPNLPNVAANRCVTYTAMGRFDEAFADCNGLLEKFPKSAFLLNNRAEIWMAKGNLETALKDYNTVLGMYPNNLRAHAGRGLVFEKKRNLDQARADYRSAAFALSKYDDPDVAKARAMAQERLAALTAEGPDRTIKTQRIALIVGNGAYANVHPLANPPRDAKLIAESLKGLGFQTVTLANDLTRDKFFETLRGFAAAAEKADWAVVYYAGHGFEIGGVNYLVPVDAKLAVDKDAETEAVALEQVLAAVGGARGLRLVMLDACRDNPFAATMQHTIAMKLVDKGFSNIEPSAGFMVVYAAKHGETALDGEGQDSPFATAVAREIKGHVEVRKLFDIIRDEVWTATQHRQQPFTYGSPPGREDFYFAGR